MAMEGFNVKMNRPHIMNSRFHVKKWRSQAKAKTSEAKARRSQAKTWTYGKEMEVSADLIYDQNHELVLQLLERLLALLVLLNDVFYYMYPLQQHSKCSHLQDHDHENHDHLTSMAGQGERMSYVGMLLRTVDRIRFLFRKSIFEDGEPFVRMMMRLKSQPEYAQGVAAIHFLTAGMCQRWIDPDSKALLYLLHLVHALKDARKTCKCDHPPIQLHRFYTEKSTKCTLQVINHLLGQCEACAATQRVRHFRKMLGDQLHPHLWVGCDECESMLMDTLVYANMLFATNFRMLASLRLSLDYAIDLSDGEHLEQGLQKIARNLFKLGFAQVDRKRRKELQQGPYNLKYQVSMDFEVMFISGCQEMKDDFNCLLMEGFLQRKEKRPFFIQCQHQLLRCDPRRKCCEAQIGKYLDEWKLGDMYYPRALRMAMVYIILEQDACGTCKEEHVPAIKQHLEQHNIPLKIVAMLDYIENSKFLPRLTAHGGPVQLKRDLQPFEEHNACMVRKCKHVRCTRKHCHYSKPTNVLAVNNM